MYAGEDTTGRRIVSKAEVHTHITTLPFSPSPTAHKTILGAHNLFCLALCLCLRAGSEDGLCGQDLQLVFLDQTGFVQQPPRTTFVNSVGDKRVYSFAKKVL